MLLDLNDKNEMYDFARIKLKPYWLLYTLCKSLNANGETNCIFVSILSLIIHRSIGLHQIL